MVYQTSAFTLSTEVSNSSAVQTKLSDFNKDSIKHKSKSESAFGVTNFKPVMRGVLYRGGAGGIRALTSDQITNLCKAGFSHAVFAYGPEGDKKKQGKSPGTYNCTMIDGRQNSIQYHYIKYNAEKEFIEIVYKVIRDQSGPVFEHCWAGNHASGELAAKALRQFCDFNPSQTFNYWLATIANPGNGDTPAVRAKNYDRVSNMTLDAATQSEICPDATLFN